MSAAGLVCEYSGKDIDKMFFELKETKLKELKKGVKKADLKDSFAIFGVGSYNEKKLDEKDKIYRYNPMQIALIVLGEDKLIIKDIDVNLIMPNQRSRTSELLYKDIVADFTEARGERKFLIKVGDEAKLDIDIFNSNDEVKAAQKAINAIKKALSEQKSE